MSEEILQFCKNVKKRREELGITQSELAKRVGYSDKSMISLIEHGKSDISQKKLIAIADALHTTPSDLLGKAEPSNFINYPVIGNIYCGYNGILQEEYNGDNESIPTDWVKGDSPSNFIVLQAKGDSLYPLVMDGDRVLIHKTSSVDSGTLAAVLVGEEVTLKRVFYRSGEDWVRLEAVNPSYPPVTFTSDKLMDIKVIGEIKKLMRNF